MRLLSYVNRFLGSFPIVSVRYRNGSCFPPRESEKLPNGPVACRRLTYILTTRQIVAHTAVIAWNYEPLLTYL